MKDNWCESNEKVDIIVIANRRRSNRQNQALWVVSSHAPRNNGSHF